MRTIDLDKFLIGLMLGILAPSLAFAVYYYSRYSFMGFSEFIDFLKLGEIYTSVISLCVLANLAVFYPFLWKEKWNAAKGVLASTFIWAGIVLVLKYIA